MLVAGRRPMGRLFYWVVTALAASGIWAAVTVKANPQSSPATTTVTDTVYLADGSVAQGTLIITWPAFMTAGGAAVAAGVTNVTLASNGSFSVALIPNTGATPAGVYYSVIYQLGPGEVKTEYWVVPTTSPANLAMVRTTPGSGIASQPVSMEYVNSELATKANDNAVVHLGGTETISGTKSFSSSPSVPSPTSSTQIANKAYVDSSVSNVGAGNYLPTAGGTMTGPITLPGPPSAPLQAASKAYVDQGFAAKADLISGLVPAGELGTGAASGTTCLMGNGTWGGCGSGSMPNASAAGQVPAATGAGTAYAARTQPYIDVRDYGVTCNGVTDDTAAFQNAVNAAINASTTQASRPLTFPYNCIVAISATINISKAAGLHMDGGAGQGEATGNTVAFVWIGANHGGPMFSINQTRDSIFERFKVFPWNTPTGPVADVVFDVDEIGTVTQITTNDEFSHIVVSNGSGGAANPNFIGFRFGNVAPGNIERMNIHDNEVVCSSANPTSGTSSGIGFLIAAGSNAEPYYTPMRNNDAIYCSRAFDLAHANKLVNIDGGDLFANWYDLYAEAGSHIIYQNTRSESCLGMPCVQALSNVSDITLKYLEFSNAAPGPQVDVSAVGGATEVSHVQWDNSGTSAILIPQGGSSLFRSEFNLYPTAVGCPNLSAVAGQAVSFMDYTYNGLCPDITKLGPSTMTGVVANILVKANSATYELCGSYQNSVTPTFALDCYNWQVQPANGMNAASSLVFGHSGTPGTQAIDFSAIANVKFSGVSASGQIVSTLATGTAPFSVASTTPVANLTLANVSQLPAALTWPSSGTVATTAQIPAASSATPAMDGTASAGSSANYARADHVHPTDTSRAADAAVVHNTGNETIAGTKTFTGTIALPDGGSASSAGLTVNGQLQIAGPWIVTSPIPGAAMAAAGAGTSALGISNDGNFYISASGGTPLKIATTATSSYFSNLVQEDANDLGEVNGTTPQGLHVYGTYSDASDYERTGLSWDATDNYFVLKNENLGTGQQIGIGFWIGNGVRWAIDTLSTLKPGSNNSFNIGSTTFAPQTVYAATSFDTLAQGRQNFELCNDGTTGTSLNLLAAYNGASPACAVKAGSSSTDGVIGVVSNGSGTSGNAVITYRGYSIEFANDAAAPLAYQDSASATAIGLQDTPARLATTQAGSYYLQDLAGAQITEVSSTTVSVDVGLAVPSGYGIEVRIHDYSWGVSNDRNLMGRFATQTFNLPRWARTQNYFLRLYDSSSPPRYSRYSAALHVDYPL